MKNRHWMYLVVGGLVGLAVLVTQRVYQRSLADQAETAEKKIERLQAGLLRRSGDNPGFVERSEGLRPGQKNLPSEERIEAATSDVEVFLESAGDSRSPVSFLKGLPDFMRSIEDLNAEELLEVVARMDGDGSPESLTETGEMLTVILLSLAGETGSEGVWEYLGEMKGEGQGMLFSSLARKEPDAALEWLKEQSLPTKSRERMAQSLISATLARDPIAALKMIRELESDGQSVQAGRLIKLNEGQVFQLEAAFQEPKNADLQKQIADILMKSASSEGIASLKEQTERLDLDGAEMMDLVFSGPNFQQPKETGEFLDWMVESVPQDHPEMPKTIFNAAQQWANRDFGAAAEWLGDLKPSKSRDFAIEGFVYSVAQLDPEAAALWALEVQGSKKRETVLAHAMKAWRQKDAVKADSWLERREGELKVSE